MADIIAKKVKKHNNSKPKKPKPNNPEEELPPELPSELIIIDDNVNLTQSKVKTLNNATNRPPSTSTTSKKRKRRDSASSDEERWLTAIESGKLEDVDDELKKIKPKDPSLMTARQRAMYDRGVEGNQTAGAPTLMSLPTGYKEKVMTAEAIQKAALKSQKRKQLADEKREKDKKKTMERLLKKQDSKATKAMKPKITRTNAPSILYKQNIDTAILCFPEGKEFSLKAAVAPDPPPAKYCEMGCGNLKKYSCYKTGTALCSLKCYQKNLSRYNKM